MNLWLVKTLVEPVRREPSHESEMVDQVIGGMILKESASPESGFTKAEWIRAEIPNGYTGYVRTWMLEPVLPSNPWCTKPGVMVNDRWLSSVPGDGGGDPVCLGMGTRCLGALSKKKRSTVEPPWGGCVKLPSAGLLSSLEPFSAGFYGGSKALERDDCLSGNALYAILNRALERSRALIGVPYLWGGVSAGGLDCSGLVHLCAGMEGLLLPRDAGDQCLWFCEREWGGDPGPAIGPESGLKSGLTLGLKPGLAFFGESFDKIDHVGLLDGAGGMIHASGHVHRTLFSPEPDKEGERLLAKCRWVVGA